MAKISKAKGGSMVGLTASNKRVGPVDPSGAWTDVQKRTLAGAKGKAVLKKDKELGATSMTAKKGAKVVKKAKAGAKVSKAEGGKWIQKAINPKHKGYCTPMTKKTCTPKRKALAVTLKKMAKARKGK
jgi:hypothetical protein